MKKIIPVFIILTLHTLVYAGSSIDEQIANIMKAPESQRVELMNQFKTKIANMNQQERSEAISRLQKGMNIQNMPMQPMQSNVQNHGSMNHHTTNNRR